VWRVWYPVRKRQTAQVLPIVRDFKEQAIRKAHGSREARTPARNTTQVVRKALDTTHQAKQQEGLHPGKEIGAD
jgi:hypothetical protein